MTGPININVSLDGKPLFAFATRVAEMVYGATGVEARRIREEGKARNEQRLLEAQTEAAIVLKQAETDIQIADKYQAAARRIIHNGLREQANLEALTEKLLELLPEEAPTMASPSDDMIHDVFEHAKHVSDQDIQSLWATLLAAEFCKPGSFSKKTIGIVSELDPSDARDFAHLCRFVWMLDEPTPLLASLRSTFFKSNGVTYGFLQNLHAIGLITFTPTQFGEIALGEDRREELEDVEIAYFGEPFHVPSPRGVFNSGRVRFTRAGHELRSLCKSEPMPGYVEHLVEYYKPIGSLIRGSGKVRMADLPTFFRVRT